MTSMEEATLAALVEEAHKNNLKVLTHTVTLERAKSAARAGVDVLAHGIGNAPVDDELIRIMKAKGTAYVSTLAVYEPRRREVDPLLKRVMDPEAISEVGPLRAVPDTGRVARFDTLLHNVAALHAAGVPMGAGTDAGVTGTYHGWANAARVEAAGACGIDSDGRNHRGHRQQRAGYCGGSRRHCGWEDRGPDRGRWRAL
jgi:imidazolonepropionase-like amidohydrolase